MFWACVPAKSTYVYCIHFDSMSTVLSMQIVPRTSIGPKRVPRRRTEKTMEDSGSMEARMLTSLGSRYFVLPRYMAKAITVPNITM